MIVTIDFETFYGVDYTLRSMSTSEYIRHELFKVHMVGIKIDDAPTRVYDDTAARVALAAIDWSEADLLCHHTAFDGFILRQHYGVVPRRYLCTLSMARGAMPGLASYALGAVAELFGLGSKLAGRLEDSKDKRDLTPEEFTQLAEYCGNDVDLNRAIYDRLIGQYPRSELDLIDITIRMFCDPVLRLDAALAEEELAAETGGKVAALLKSGVSAITLMSNDKFADLLRSHNVVVPQKISKTTGRPAYAFAKQDANFRALLHHPSETVRQIVEARLKVKSTIGETRARRLLEEAKDGPIPIYLNYYGAHTGRWSGGNKMNPQNLPRPEFDEDGNLLPDTGRLRRSLLAPEGHVLVVADSAQIEARVTAWLADQYDLLDAFREKRDIYSEFAGQVYGKPVSKRDKVERFVGKTCILGLGFGMGGQRLRETLLNGAIPVDLELRRCFGIVDLYRMTYSGIPALWKLMQDRAIAQMLPGGSGGGWKCLRWEARKHGGRMYLPNGMFLSYRGLARDVDSGDYHYEAGRSTTKLYGGLLTENVVQAIARIVVAEQMRTIATRHRIALMTHDEVVAVVPEDQADAALAFMLDTMQTAPAWAPDLPVAAEGGYDVCYSK